MSEGGRQGAAKRRRPPTSMDPEEQAAILAYAKLHGAPKAAAKFEVSTRSIDRWRRAIRDGRAPRLAELVEAQRKEATRRSSDLICETTDMLLLELQGRREKLSNEELIDAVEKVGQLRVTRDALNPHGEPAGADQPSPSPAEGAVADSGDAVRAPGSEGAIASAARGDEAN